jgi:hypothetical protein
MKSSLQTFLGIIFSNNLKLSFFTFYLLINFIGFSQTPYEYKYFIGHSNPDSGWRNKNFDDSSWLTGHGSIGYGDNDDTIVVDTTVSVYIRYKLPVQTDYLSQIQAMVLFADFDDAYIAYLNGNEVLRVNIDKEIANPDYLQIAGRSHEAENYRGIQRVLQGYYLDSVELKNASIDTSNLLAFEVHNDSIKGSDLSFDFHFRFIDASSSYSLYWNDCRYTAQVQIDSSILPFVVIETDEFGTSPEKSKAFMGIINNSPGKYNKLTDAFSDYKGRIRINERGKTSADFPKKNYSIELQDSAGKNNNVSLMGMPKENDWILYGPFPDKSQIRNKLIYSLGEKMGHYEPRNQFCELIVNGRNMGLYALTERIKQDSNRVNVAKLKITENDGIPLTGGYLFKFEESDPMDIIVVYPKDSDITKQQKTYIHDYYDQSEEILHSNNFMNPATGYRKYIDDQSLIDYIIINELSKNMDAYMGSCYMYKDRDDRDGRIKYGPLWDYDFSMGYNIWSDITPIGWQFEERANQIRLSIARFIQDTAFTHNLAAKWHSYRERILSNDSINKYIDNMVDTYAADIDINYRVWPIIQYGFNNNISMYEGKTYPEEIQKLKNWFSERTNWIDANIDNLYYPVVGINETFADNSYAYFYPNPFINDLNLTLKIEKSGFIRYEIFDIAGRKCAESIQGFSEAGTNDLKIDIPGNMHAGIYLIVVYQNNLPIVSQKLIKIK